LFDYLKVLIVLLYLKRYVRGIFSYLLSWIIVRCCLFKNKEIRELTLS